MATTVIGLLQAAAGASSLSGAPSSVSIFHSAADDFMTLTGTNRFLVYPGLANGVYTGTFTFAAWIKTSTVNRTQVILSRSGWFARSSSDFPFSLHYGTDGKLYCNIDGGGDFSHDLSVSATVSLADNTWHQVGVILTASVLKLFVDGVEVLSSNHTVTLVASTNEYWLGAPVVYNGVTQDSVNFIGKIAFPVFAPAINSVTLITEHFALSNELV